MAEPTKGALHEPAPFQNDGAFLIGLLLHDAARHAMDVAPVLAALGRVNAVEVGQAQAGLCLLALIEALRRQTGTQPGLHVLWAATF